MPTLDIGQAKSSDLSNAVDNAVISPENTEGAQDQDESVYNNEIWTQNWGYFNKISELKSAILMKAIWNVGKGYTADPETTVILDHISGWGKDSFEDILFNMEVIRRIGRDSLAQIIRDKDTGILINLKPLDPASMRWFVDRKGILLRYEQFNKLSSKKETIHKFKPEEIFHLSLNRLADQCRGISDIESMEKTILAEEESFNDLRSIMHRQARPMIFFKLKTDNAAKISAFVAKVDKATNEGENVYIPDDENLLSYEVVQVNVSNVVMAWRNDVKNKFYRALGLPQIVFGAGNATESGGKMEYFAHEQVFEHDQRYIEKQVWNQLYLRINLIPPNSMAQDLQTDQGKDANQGLEIQPSDITAGVGR